MARMIRGDRPGFYSRPQARAMIAGVMGIPEPPEGAPYEERREWEDVYNKLHPVFHDPNVPSEVIGSGGRTNRLRQVRADALFDFAKRTFGVEIDEWRPDGAADSELLGKIAQVLTQREEGIWPSDTAVVDAIRRIMSQRPDNQPPDQPGPGVSVQ